MLVKTAGVQKLVVVINKMDDATVKWDKERYACNPLLPRSVQLISRHSYDEIVSKLSPYLKGTGFNPKTDVTFIPVSAYTGANMKEKVDPSLCSWFKGESLLGFLDTMPLNDRKNNAPLLMPITEKYNDMGTVVVGKIESGRIRKGAQLTLMPNKVRSSPLHIASCEAGSTRRPDAGRSHQYHERERSWRVATCGTERRQRPCTTARRQ